MQAATGSPAAVRAFLLFSFKEIRFYKSKIKFIVTPQLQAPFDDVVCAFSTYGMSQKKDSGRIQH